MPFLWVNFQWSPFCKYLDMNITLDASNSRDSSTASCIKENCTFNLKGHFIKERLSASLCHM